MQWAFLVLAVLAALVELNTGTFYLAGVAAAALLTTLIGFWLRDDWLIFVFLLLCLLLTVIVMLFRRNLRPGKGLVDFDIGQIVSVCGMSPHGDRLSVSYRGANWEAVTDDGSVLVPGDIAIIVRKTDKLLHLALPPAAAPTRASAKNDI
jgi:membrane protein implicated in regulation of membrane protease activity